MSREKLLKAKPVNSSQQFDVNTGPRCNANDGSKNQSNRNKGVYSVGAFNAKEKKPSQTSNQCRYCEKSHWSNECDKLKTVKERTNRS